MPINRVVIPTAQNSVEQEVMEAYCDAHEEDFEKTLDRRKLQFKASQPVTRDEAIRIMGRAIPGGYNEFKASLLKHLPEESMVTIARESSVCIYVTPGVDAAIESSLKCDEFDTEGDSTRIWWD